MKAKTYILMAIVLAIVLSPVSCDMSTQKKVELLIKENEALCHEAGVKDSILNEFFVFLSEIEYNLRLINLKERTISKNVIAGGDLKPDVRHQIDEDIQTINMLMDENRSKAALLRKKLADANLKVAELERMIANVNQKLNEKGNEIERLKESLLKFNFTVEQLNARIDTLIKRNYQINKEMRIEIEQVNSAWYAVGSRKELVRNNVIEKSGGFMGLGKTSRLKAEFNPDYFVKIDITKTGSIPIAAKKVNFVTTHPTDSYLLIKNSDNVVVELKITNPQKFWSVSKYLVVEVN